MLFCSKHFIYVNPFNPHDIAVKSVLLLPLFYRWWKLRRRQRNGVTCAISQKVSCWKLGTPGRKWALVWNLHTESVSGSSPGINTWGRRKRGWAEGEVGVWCSLSRIFSQLLGERQSKDGPPSFSRIEMRRVGLYILQIVPGKGLWPWLRQLSSVEDSLASCLLQPLPRSGGRNSLVLKGGSGGLS